MASSPSSTWYKIRDTFCGHNFVSRDIPRALEMTASCEHPDARWLSEACAGKDVKTAEDAKRVFFSLGPNDARALCFGWVCCVSLERRNLSALRRSAELGFAFAQALMAEEGERCKFAQLAAAQGERDGFVQVGHMFRFGFGCERSLERAKKYYLLASELGAASAMIQVGELCDVSDPQRWQWWGRAAGLGNSFSFLSTFSKQVEGFKDGSGSAAVMFSIGRALHGQVNEEVRTIFGCPSQSESRIGLAKQAIAFYELQIMSLDSCWHPLQRCQGRKGAYCKADLGL